MVSPTAILVPKRIAFLPTIHFSTGDCKSIIIIKIIITLVCVVEKVKCFTVVPGPVWRAGFENVIHFAC